MAEASSEFVRALQAVGVRATPPTLTESRVTGRSLTTDISTGAISPKDKQTLMTHFKRSPERRRQVRTGLREEAETTDFCTGMVTLV